MLKGSAKKEISQKGESGDNAVFVMMLLPCNLHRPCIMLRKLDVVY